MNTNSDLINIKNDGACSNLLPPPGLEALVTHCNSLYPDQPNPLCVSTLKKFWRGGPDPLDLINMYNNPGDISTCAPPHWHYVSFGLSDLHGDERIHNKKHAPGASGFGFELTFRLKKEPGDVSPPTWPAVVLQMLARYVYQSGNLFYSGDHVSWHCPLDCSDSRIQHILLIKDPELNQAVTPFGTVDYIQVVGVCKEELKAAQHWNVEGVTKVLQRMINCGGSLLVTDMRRGESIFEIDPSIQEEINEGIENDGSNLSGVGACFDWIELNANMQNVDCSFNVKLNDYNSDNDEEFDAFESSPYKSNFESKFKDSPELLKVKHLKGVNLLLNLEAATLIPLILRGRLQHGRHFTFKSLQADAAVTFVSSNVSGTFTSHLRPYVVLGGWLQILISDDLRHKIHASLSTFFETQNPILPFSFRWKDSNFMITVYPDEMLIGNQVTQQ